jgi:hypothetical protein
MGWRLMAVFGVCGWRGQALVTNLSHQHSKVRQVTLQVHLSPCSPRRLTDDPI